MKSIIFIVNSKIFLIKSLIILQFFSRVKLDKLKEETSENNIESLYVDVVISPKFLNEQESRLNKQIDPGIRKNNKTLDEINFEIDILPNNKEFFFNLLKNKQLSSDNHRNMHTKFNLMYKFGIYSEIKNSNSLNQTVENYLKIALLKFFDKKSTEIDVRLVSLDKIKNDSNEIAFNPTVINIESNFQLSKNNISNSLINFAINRNKCTERNTSIKCDSSLKDETSLLYFSEFWISLNNPDTFRRFNYGRNYNQHLQIF